MADIREDGSELVHFDDPEFQVQFRKNDIPEWYTFDELTIHWHDEVEFIYVIKGSVKYQLNGKMVLMREGEGIFVNARQIHLITTAGEECCLYFIQTGIDTLYLIMIFNFTSIITHHANFICKFLIICNNGTCISKCTKIFSRIKAKAA